MALTPGTRLGPYEITTQISGMGSDWIFRWAKLLKGTR